MRRLLSLTAGCGAPLLTLLLAVAAPQATSAATPMRDRGFRGQIALEVDATDTRHGTVTTRETIPVQDVREMVLLYPEWETASHAPTIPLAALTGLVVSVDGHRVEWRRDPLNVHVFHVPLPLRARQVMLEFRVIADRGAMRRDMLSVPWQRVLLYPAGWSARALPVVAQLRLPAGLAPVTALDRDPVAGAAGAVRFAPTTLDRLVDAPVLAARYSRLIDLAPGAAQPVRLDALAEDSTLLRIGEPDLHAMRALVAQTLRVFGPPPFRHYDAIVALDDEAGAGGIEHLEEGENTLPSRTFTDPASQIGNRDLIAHELVHAWNGRYRQPADLWTPTYNQPVGGSLLWVYEGQTEFWGRVLAARAGMRSMQDSLDRLAIDAALVAQRPGRAWKTLADSGNDATYMAGHRVAWRDWQRREDYYPEGVLLWLDVEARLRERSGGRIGLDDFAARFFHAPAPDGKVRTYTFDDVCRVLTALVADDWPRFLDRHLTTHDDRDALAGLARAGWRLVWTAEPSAAFRQNEAEEGSVDLTYSIGATVGEDGRLGSVAWDGPAFRAGLNPGARITAIAGAPFTPDALRSAVAATPATPLTLTIGIGAAAERVTIPYRQGLRTPRLERIPGTPDRLTPLLAPR